MTHFIGKQQTIYINGADRASGTCSNFTYKIQLDDPAYNHVAVKMCSIPKTYYMVQSPYNTFTLKDGDAKQTTHTITVPEGNYSIRALSTELNSLCTVASGVCTYVWDTANAYNECDTGKFTISVSGNSTQPQIIFSGEDLYRTLGFNKNTTNTFSANTLTSTNIVFLQRTSVVILCSSLISPRGLQPPVLQQIPAHISDFEFMTFQCPDIIGYSKPISHQSGVYSFTLYDTQFRNLDLNGIDISLTLIFFTKNDTDELHRESLLIDQYDKLTSSK